MGFTTNESARELAMIIIPKTVVTQLKSGQSEPLNSLMTWGVGGVGFPEKSGHTCNQAFRSPGGECLLFLTFSIELYWLPTRESWPTRLLNKEKSGEKRTSFEGQSGFFPIKHNMLLRRVLMLRLKIYPSSGTQRPCWFVRVCDPSRRCFLLLVRRVRNVLRQCLPNVQVVCVCVCFLPIHSGHQWTYQPGSHRRKVTQDF